jgi:hypothetical protein
MEGTSNMAVYQSEYIHQHTESYRHQIVGLDSDRALDGEAIYGLGILII